MLISKRVSVFLGWMTGLLGLLSAGCHGGNGLPTCDTPTHVINNCNCPTFNPNEPVFSNPKSMCCVDPKGTGVCKMTSTTNPAPDAGMAMAPPSTANVLVATPLTVVPAHPSPCAPFAVTWTWQNYGNAASTTPTGGQIPTLTIAEVGSTGLPTPITGNVAWSAGLPPAATQTITIPVPAQGGTDAAACTFMPTFILTLSSTDSRISDSVVVTLDGADNGDPLWGKCAVPNSSTCTCDPVSNICS